MSNRKPMPGGRPALLTEMEVQRMRDRYDAGASFREIGKAFGTSANTVRLLVRGIRAASAAGRARPVRVEAGAPQ